MFFSANQPWKRSVPYARGRRRRYWVAATAIVVASGYAALPGAAAAPINAERDCVVDITTSQESCFTDFRSAMRFASGGRITDAPANARTATVDSRLMAQVRALTPTTADNATPDEITADKITPHGNPVIGATVFADKNYGGASYTFMIPRPCAKDGWYDYSYELRGEQYRNLESVQPWANCWIWLHESTWDGRRQGPFRNNTPDLGDWNNRAVLLGLS